ncbi:hypothetical protein DYB32_003636 [Aphanomyces invadans]|uniref:Uncharacterized protein n=1 Tax=Aphanomyces invadans TaxID=157072 RepID=A0A3R7D2F4_9STRA|nr:hypothetical protein DYB32_003636 [Aphanomyces invadans]
MHTTPTVGFNVEMFRYKNVEFTAWDIGGQEKLRGVWHHCYQNTDAVIFVVDSNDIQRVGQAADELHRMFQETELENAKLLVYANKQDLPNALSISELSDKLQLDAVTPNAHCMQPCVAVTAAGLYEGLEWLSKALLYSSSAFGHLAVIRSFGRSQHYFKFTLFTCCGILEMV